MLSGVSCDDYAPAPHSLSCLRQWWTDAGCSPAGRSSPDNDPSNVAWWNERDAADVRSDMALYYEYASGGYADYPAKCQGIGKGFMLITGASITNSCRYFKICLERFYKPVTLCFVTQVFQPP